jgi:hypothetical protein
VYVSRIERGVTIARPLSSPPAIELTDLLDGEPPSYLRCLVLSRYRTTKMEYRDLVALEVLRRTAHTFDRGIPMRTASSVATPTIFHKLYMALAMLVASLLFFGAPRQAAAQNDALRELAERVMQDRNGGWNDRDGRWDDRDGSRRQRDQWERERIAREQFCRRNRNDRRCDDYYRYDQNSSRRGAWCLDQDRNNRCDASRARHDNGRHRGWDKDDWKRDRDDWKRGRNGRR